MGTLRTPEEQMRQSKIAVASLVAALCTSLLPAQLSTSSSSKVDFGKDVLPVLRQNCVGCHGPSQQNAGLRLDRRSSVFKVGARRIVPGSAENSFIYHRLTSSTYGPQMPPSGPLRPEQIAVVKTWIEQGAEWPDALANEVERPQLNPKAVAMVEMLRQDNRKGFMKEAEADPKLLNARGPDGGTPFMYAVLYADTAMVATLLKKGANPNMRTDGNATALMWAGPDAEKMRLLVQHGADVNAKSDELRTPLMIAARHPGMSATLKMLLDKGANPNPNAHPDTESSPLIEAASAPDPESVDLLLKRGANTKGGGQTALSMAAQLRCSRCLELLAARITDKDAYTFALGEAVAAADLASVRLLIDHGADVKAFDPLGRTPLMYAAESDRAQLDVVKLLVEKGANVNAKDKHEKSGDAGMSVLDIAKQQGQTPIVEYLEKAGAGGTPRPSPALKVRKENSVQRAIEDSLPLLQKVDVAFVQKAGCTSCHNNSITGMAISFARKKQILVDESMAAQQVKANAFGIEKFRDRLLQGFMFPTEDFFAPFVEGYVLVSLHGENYTADLNTDAVAIYLKGRQSPDGQWSYPLGDTRPPLCLSHVSQTALAMRSLQLYAPKSDRGGYEKAVQLASTWLAKEPARNTEDLSWKVLGLAWADREQAAKRRAMDDLLALQGVDGGWSDLPTLGSSVYQTGKALYALYVAGLPTTNDAYQKGVRYLLANQLEDGTWYVKTRALGFQPYVEAGFPHGYDQWMSTAGSGWAVMALTATLPDTKASR
jgi:ankyrin repeat protein